MLSLSLAALLPAYLISEIRTSFEIGFMIYLPFLIIDLVIASMLISMGMIVLPPMMVSLPFKLMLFVLLDGWNLVLSALVFSAGTLVALRRGWRSQRFTPLASKATASELIRVLAYPKFRLNAEEREDLLADYLPFCQTVQVPNPPPPTPPCRDPFDVPFLELTLAGEADFLVTGDQDLLSLASEFSRPIVNPNSFLKHLEPT